jgi:hypothetical protein
MVVDVGEVLGPLSAGAHATCKVGGWAANRGRELCVPPRFAHKPTFVCRAWRHGSSCQSWCRPSVMRTTRSCTTWLTWKAGENYVSCRRLGGQE